jgi:hypothetical protein
MHINSWILSSGAVVQKTLCAIILNKMKKDPIFVILFKNTLKHQEDSMNGSAQTLKSYENSKALYL